jgi:hypothetical protein
VGVLLLSERKCEQAAIAQVGIWNWERWCNKKNLLSERKCEQAAITRLLRAMLTPC